MKLVSSTAILLAICSLASSLSVPNSNNALHRRTAESETELIDASLTKRIDGVLYSYLEKRRGGGGSSGGGGGGGGSGGGGGRAGGSSSSGSSSSSSGSSGSSSGSKGSSGGSSGSRNTGTASSSSSVKPSYGGGRYYGGGATSAYSAGRRSPLGILPLGLGIGAAALIFPGLWLYSVYNYPYTNQYRFHNGTRNRTTTKRQEQDVMLPVTCLCQQYNACGCDDNGNTTYLDSIVGDGTNLNSSLVHIGPVNGTPTVVLNGTLPNGTDTSASSSSSGDAISQRVLELSGIWAIGGIVAATVMLL